MGNLERLPAIYSAAKSEYLGLDPKITLDTALSAEGNFIALGDNAVFMLKARNQGARFDFVYIDPPFYSGENYRATVKKDGEKKKTMVYKDKWGSLDEYLGMLTLRLMLIKDLLKDSGSVAIHLDTHAVHYVKVLADEIFGAENFINEIIWSYKSGGMKGKYFAKKHDSILVYSKTKEYYFKPQKEVSYNRGGRPYRFKGVEEFCDEQGKWYTLVNRKDVVAIDMVGRTSSERTGYATQKPEKLLDIILESFCPEDGVCADFFCGSGTLGAAAAKKGMHFVLCDASEVAIKMASERFDKENITYSII
ncbi:MAG: site-specific DNA-methyltransferase [Clostridia bacterium]|nr:site-specific DNA-methyltransferase [Clostridia bacterium]